MNRLKAAWNVLTGKSLFPEHGTSVRYKDGQVTYVNDSFDAYLSKGYSMNDVVYSIAHITSEKIKVAPWNVYQIKDESSLKLLQAEYRKGISHKNYKRVLDLRTKALELYEGDSKLNELLKWPNEVESFSDLVAHSSIAKMMMGNRFIEATVLDFGLNVGKPQELRLLPTQHVSIINNRAYPIKSVAYQLNVGTIIPIPLERVMHDKYYNPHYDSSGSHLYGQAPLKAALRTLTNDNSAIDASTFSFQNQGPGQVMYVDDERLSGEQAMEQAAAVKRKFHEEYTGSKNARKTVISGYKIGVEQMGLSPVDLDIITQGKWNLVRFCNVWNFPHQLLMPEHSTENNLSTAGRQLIQTTCMPLMTSFRDNFNRKLQTDWGYKGKNIYVDFDLSVYSELQQDMGKLTDWIMKSWHLTPRMRYELQQLDVPEEMQNDPLLDRIYVPSGFQDISMLDPAEMDRQLDEQDKIDEDDKDF